MHAKEKGHRDLTESLRHLTNSQNLTRTRAADEGLREELRALTAHLEAVEAGRRRDPELGDDSGEEAVVIAEESEEETQEVKLLRSVLLTSNKPKLEIPNYDGNLSADVPLDWMSELDKYFEKEEISEDKRVRFVATKLKGHATLWWDNVQEDRKRMNKLLIKKWPRMVDLRVGYTEDTPEKTTRYVNSLRLEILDEINILSSRNIEEAFQSAVKVEEKINRKQNNRRGRGQSYDRGRTATNNVEGSNSRALGTIEKGDSTRGVQPYQSFECPEAEQAGQRGTFVAQPEEAEALPQEVENVVETGEALVLNKVLLNPAKETAEQTQRKALFQTICKSHGKCYKLIIDSGSTDNLVATEMVEKLGLK
eukprot:PITA_25668